MIHRAEHFIISTCPGIATLQNASDQNLLELFQNIITELRAHSICLTFSGISYAPGSEVGFFGFRPRLVINLARFLAHMPRASIFTPLVDICSRINQCLEQGSNRIFRGEIILALVVGDRLIAHHPIENSSEAFVSANIDLNSI